MKGLPEELLYVLIFGAILLFQYLMKRFGPQQQPQPAQDEPDAELPAQPVPVAVSVSSPTDTLLDRSRAAEASTAPARRRFSRQSLMGNRRAVQNAIVIATILGPCRAHEPHDIR